MSESSDLTEASRIESDITQEDLARIAGEINIMPPSDRGDLTTAEFGWLYSPGRHIQSLEVKKDLSILGKLMMKGNAFIPDEIIDTDAIATIHNHPPGTEPSFEDVNFLLKTAAKNRDLRYELIAATDSGKVSGFYELKFTGDRSKALDLVKKNNALYIERIMMKRDWLSKHPEEEAKLLVGDSVFSLSELGQLAEDAMDMSSVNMRIRPLNGFVFRDHHFVPGNSPR